MGRGREGPHCPHTPQTPRVEGGGRCAGAAAGLGGYGVRGELGQAVGGSHGSPLAPPTPPQPPQHPAEPLCAAGSGTRGVLRQSPALLIGMVDPRGGDSASSTSLPGSNRARSPAGPSSHPLFVAVFRESVSRPGSALPCWGSTI